MAKRIVISIVCTAVLLTGARRLSTRNPRDVSTESAGVRVLHRTVTEQVGAGAPAVELDIPDSPRAAPFVVYHTGAGTALERRAMTRAADGRWTAALPDLGKGKRLSYAFEIELPGGTVARLPEDASGFYLIKYKGKVSPAVLILHIAAMFGSFFFMVMGLFGAVAILRGREGKRRTVVCGRWVLLLSFLGGWPLGFMLNYQAFGPVWEGFPFGFDVTDNKTQIMFLCWLVSLLLVRGSLFGRGEETDRLGPRGFAAAVIASFVISVVLFIVPHSL
jgi:hypothetical protein